MRQKVAKLNKHYYKPEPEQEFYHSQQQSILSKQKLSSIQHQLRLNSKEMPIIHNSRMSDINQ